MRAFRPGSLILGALQQVALSYLNRDGDSIPFWRMAQTPISELTRRAEAISAGKTISTMSMTGGGSLPGEEIPSVGIELEGDLSACLRQADIPVIARVREQTTIIDLRTVHPEDDELVANAINSCF